jgi:RNA polymerase sigma-70 factor (ECF subfamily)
MDTGTDERSLVDKARAGDRAAFAALAERHEAALALFAARQLERRGDAADVVQASLARALEHLGDLEDRSAFRGWLYAIALNECRRRRRGLLRLKAALSRLGELVSARGGPSLEADDAEAVRAAVRGLPERQRLAVELRIWDGLSCEEAARALGVAEGTVKANFHHALAKLRERLGER